MQKIYPFLGLLALLLVISLGIFVFNDRSVPPNSLTAAVINMTGTKISNSSVTTKTKTLQTPIEQQSTSIFSKLKSFILQTVSRGQTSPKPQPQEKSLCIPPPPDMISWWSGDTDGSDIETTPNINNGNLQNGTIITTGKVDHSFYFDGVNDYVEVPNDASLTSSTNKFTFDFWMKPIYGSAVPKILIYKAKEYRVMSDGANIFFEVTNSSTGGRYVSTTNTPLTINLWNFVAVTFDGSTQTLQIYVNGILVPITPNTLFSNGTVQTLINQPTNLRFGSDYGTSNYYKGSIDEIEFFHRVLTLSEIQSIYSADSEGKCKTTQPQQACVQDSWTQKVDFGGGVRSNNVGFSIGNKGYIGTGANNSYTGQYHINKDFWEYDPTTNIWTQKADFGGGERVSAVGFSIGNKGYVGTGSTYVSHKDFWEYDPTTNIWTQKADFGGGERGVAVSFSIGNKGYIGMGQGVNSNQFWEYDPTTNIWTQKADFEGVERGAAVGFSIGNKGYVGTGFSNDDVFHKDFWEYDPITDAWTQKADFGGIERGAAVGFSIGNKGYVGTGRNPFTPAVFGDFWEYDPLTNIWTQRANFGGGVRSNNVGFSIGNKGYIGTGYVGGYKKDFWEYCPIE